MALIALFAPMARSTKPVHDLLRSLADSDYTTLLLAPKPPEVIARAISTYGHLSLARPTAMLSLAVIAARPAHDF